MTTGDTPASSRLVRLAAGLWLTFGFVVWNVVFDHELVVAGRNYSQAASVAFREHRPYERLNDWMPVKLRKEAAPALALSALSAEVVQAIRAVVREEIARAGLAPGSKPAKSRR